MDPGFGIGLKQGAFSGGAKQQDVIARFGLTDQLKSGGANGIFKNGKPIDKFMLNAGKGIRVWAVSFGKSL